MIRHAKSCWDDPDLDDRQRPLNKRGKRDAPFMARELKARKIRPDTIVSSPALRAQTTAELMAEGTGFKRSGIVIREAIYEQGLSGLLDTVHELRDDWDTVFLVGHNPDLTLFINELTGETLTHIPTCAIASIRFPADSWTHIMPGSGSLVFFDYPKRHPELTKN